jgi:hypothetical protein
MLFQNALSRRRSSRGCSREHFLGLCIKNEHLSTSPFDMSTAHRLHSKRLHVPEQLHVSGKAGAVR